jgi:hypothetical protein
MQSTMTYILGFIRDNIAPELLQLAFKPRKYNTTVEQRIISEIIEGPILLDTNLVGGKRRDIYINPSWRMDINYSNDFNIAGPGVESSFYLIPDSAREYRNISSVIGITPFIGGAYPGGIGTSAGMGNTATAMLGQMINTRTFSQTAVQPTVTLEGTNIIRFTPELLTDGLAVTVMLEFDAEFLNMRTSSMLAMRELCLCAVQRYIATNVRVSVDETEIVAGMEIGVIKTMVEECVEKAKDYNDRLRSLKGTLTFDPSSFSRIIYHAL